MIFYVKVTEKEVSDWGVSSAVRVLVVQILGPEFKFSEPMTQTEGVHESLLDSLL